ncbi:hypothetical protein POVWA2_007710 [Plasmodium ovale wallikeri]|uniref:Uncharacterized protein n=1 Tax=Plasmodium ovale wallikeri TaxID=864142 RepID=A0A1A8YKK2_PLAOA|nr:hypothetical protein POVWA2_007710 [Plasmodium ovale wallikeri]
MQTNVCLCTCECASNCISFLPGKGKPPFVRFMRFCITEGLNERDARPPSRCYCVIRFVDFPPYCPSYCRVTATLPPRYSRVTPALLPAFPFFFSFLLPRERYFPALKGEML